MLFILLANAFQHVTGFIESLAT